MPTRDDLLKNKPIPDLYVYAGSNILAEFNYVTEKLVARNHRRLDITWLAVATPERFGADIGVICLFARYCTPRAADQKLEKPARKRFVDCLLANGELHIRRIGARVLSFITELQRYGRINHKRLVS